VNAGKCDYGKCRRGKQLFSGFLAKNPVRKTIVGRPILTGTRNGDRSRTGHILKIKGDADHSCSRGERNGDMLNCLFKDNPICPRFLRPKQAPPTPAGGSVKQTQHLLPQFASLPVPASAGKLFQNGDRPHKANGPVPVLKQLLDSCSGDPPFPPLRRGGRGGRLAQSCADRRRRHDLRRATRGRPLYWTLRARIGG